MLEYFQPKYLPKIATVMTENTAPFLARTHEIFAGSIKSKYLYHTGMEIWDAANKSVPIVLLDAVLRLNVLHKL